MREGEREMSASTYQGGPACEIFSPQGTDPLRNVKTHGHVRRLFDKELRGYALVCDGGSGAASNTKVEFPAGRGRALGLTQRYLAMQLRLPASAEALSMEMTVLDAQRTRRRLVISSGFRAVVANPLHVQLPLASGYSADFGRAADEADDPEAGAPPPFVVPRGLWFTLCLDMQELVAANFGGVNFRSLSSLAVSGSCMLRRIFTLKDSPMGLMHGEFGQSGRRVFGRDS